MALINKLDNSASITYNGSTINSNTVETLLLLSPVLLKTVDKALANIGDTLLYTVSVTNPGLSPFNSLPFTDVLPVGSTYVEGSFKVNGTAATPTISGSTLSYTIPSIAALGVAAVTFQVTVVGGNA